MKAKKERTVSRRKSSVNIQFRLRGQEKRPYMEVTFKLTPQDGVFRSKERDRRPQVGKVLGRDRGGRCLAQTRNRKKTR